MGTTSIKQIHFQRSTKIREIIFDIVVYLFIVLFMYTAASKLLGVKSFASTLARSPLIGSYSLLVAWGISIIEIMVSILLIIPTFRKVGLWASLLLMLSFTAYLIYMVYSGNELPCHCGGVISQMTWQQHIWFNLGFVALAITGITTNKK